MSKEDMVVWWNGVTVNGGVVIGGMVIGGMVIGVTGIGDWLLIDWGKLDGYVWLNQAQKSLVEVTLRNFSVPPS